MAQQVVLPIGTLTLPPGFTHQAQQGTESYPGSIVAQVSSLVIYYDIGPMAGAHVHPSRRADPLTLPANFEATIGDAREVAAFMAIVTSYRPRSKR